MIIIQSYIDLITNSSTSVFQWANNVNEVKEIINSVLKSAGSDLKCDDLFDITIHYDINVGDAFDYYMNQAYSIIQKNPGKYLKLEQLLENLNNPAKLKELELEEEIYKYLVENCGVKTLDEYAEDYNNNSYDYLYSSYYSIEAKNPENKKYADVIHKINNLFEYDACYC